MADFLIKHKIASRVFIIWAMVIITRVILHYTNHPLGSANGADGVIFGAIFGLPAVAIGFLKWSRRGED